MPKTAVDLGKPSHRADTGANRFAQPSKFDIRAGSDHPHSGRAARRACCSRRWLFFAALPVPTPAFNSTRKRSPKRSRPRLCLMRPGMHRLPSEPRPSVRFLTGAAPTNVSLMAARGTRGDPKRNRLFSGCHGHGFAWPCFGHREDTATQRRDRGTQNTIQLRPARVLGQPLRTADSHWKTTWELSATHFVLMYTNVFPSRDQHNPPLFLCLGCPG